MFSIFKKKKSLNKQCDKKMRFDKKILRENNISVLILDERWNYLFKNIEKTDKIIKMEKELVELLKEQSRLNLEFKEINMKKKRCIKKIIELTPKVFKEEEEDSIIQMKKCEKFIKETNVRFKEIEKELDSIPDKIKEKNLELLENVVNTVYFKFRENQKRLKELEELIEETKSSLERYVDEKEKLSEDDTDIYIYFHDLIGKEELERLDREYFGE